MSNVACFRSTPHPGPLFVDFCFQPHAPHPASGGPHPSLRATLSHPMGEGIYSVGRFPGVAAARQRRANFRCAFSAFQSVEIRAIRVKPFAIYFRWKTNSPLLALTLILSPGSKSPASSLVAKGFSNCSCTADEVLIFPFQRGNRAPNESSHDREHQQPRH